MDFKSLRTSPRNPATVDPLEIFRRLPKPPGINDLYTSQAEVLQAWYGRRQQKDVVVKLHTGGGKTLVGLLIAQSSLTETREPVLYLTPTVQLVNQTLEKAKSYGIRAVGYEKGKDLNEQFTNGTSVMVATYNALFHGLSKFGVRGQRMGPTVSTVILDDAHAAFSVVRDAFTLSISAEAHRGLYQSLAMLFRNAFNRIDKLGTFDDILSGSEFAVLEVPYWSWQEQLDAVREQLRPEGETFKLVWPLLRDSLSFCHALISRSAFTITPILPLVNMFPAFSDAQRRVYMSATIADDSEIIRCFDADAVAVSDPLKSRSLAGISERMILIPDLMRFNFNIRKTVRELSASATTEGYGCAILVGSDTAAKQWSEVATVAVGPEQVEKAVDALQNLTDLGPFVFSNRYDGIDLPGNSCRLLVMSGLPSGTSNYELYRASALYGGTTITRILAQRIEQGIGRGARGSGDFCVVLLVGSDLASWVAREANFRFLTSATRAQLDMGADVSKAVENLEDLRQTVLRCFHRDTDWTQYHAETLAELVSEDPADGSRYQIAAAERKAFTLWQDGYHDKAIGALVKITSTGDGLDAQMRGWLEQFAGRISNNWGNEDRAEELQRSAFGHNRNLLRPKIREPYRSLPLPGSQPHGVINQIKGYRNRRGVIQAFEDAVSFLNHQASANQFEESLCVLGRYLGFVCERRDVNGEGPDVLWLLPGKTGLVIEAKSRKKEANALTKNQHGQLLVASEWFAKFYAGYKCVRVSVHPSNQATRAAVAGASHALTYPALGSLISDLRVLLSTLCESQLPDDELVNECSNLLLKCRFEAGRFAQEYLVPFQDE
ncbi:replicative superfamily II helicase [Roseimicrobium gellanilyticum]|uniref:Replicative superfamily II helicase n=1 Tax=Roseimicrobium gellanilyticum TaxID=748857 RepID=A0A366HHC4_9BACT|nr:DEAD/DEAH box helicase [Roseimicrobium gellanilyticum]RBP41460.1 replicative superfamily II helicase [Roseimicrobium gellanilyticum]